MSYCINPDCPQRENPDGAEQCLSCGTSLYICDWYKLLKPLRHLDFRHYTDVFEIDDGGVIKVMKVLKVSDSLLVKQFQREAEALQLFHHPGIPKVDDGGYFSLTLDTGRELHCLVMEKIAGQNLEEWVTQHGRLSQAQALDWLRQLVEILDLMHGLDFFHRDIKPSNIMVRPDGQLALIDFGAIREVTDTYLAKVAGGAMADAHSAGDITIVTSAGYAPLEQVNGKPVPQSDFYALGRTFVYLLTGRSPLSLPDDANTGQLQWHQYAPQIAKPLANFIDQLMAPAVRKRPQDTQAILHYLKHQLPLQLRIDRVLRSVEFKVSIAALLLLSGVGAYQLSRIIRADYQFRQGNAALLAEPPRLDDARLWYESAVRLQPKNPLYHNNLALACRRLEDYNCAKKHYQQALQLDPNYAAARYSLGSLYDKQGNYTQAEYHYRLAMQSDQPPALLAIASLARLYILQERYTDALKLTHQGLTTPNLEALPSGRLTKAALLNYAGWALFKQKDYAQAQRNLQQALTLDPERASAHCLLGQVYEAQGNKARAIVAWQGCLHYTSDAPEVKQWQADLLKRL